MNKIGVLTAATLLLICSCNSNKSKDSSATTADNNPPMEIPPVVNPGPVDVAKSNFFYAGDLIITKQTSTLQVCATGNKVTLVNDLGAYDKLHQYYTKVYPSSKSVFAMVRGYMLPKSEGKQATDSLVVTDLIDMKADLICAPNNNLVGSYNGTYTTKQGEKVNIILSMSKDNQFLFVVKGAKSDSMIEQVAGEWQLLSMNQLMISYMTESNYLSPQASINYKTQTITWSNSQGDSIVLDK
jgi:hypothetical protein